MDADGERSLPGTTASKWMRRPTERFSYEDICASPPTNPDGFFHMKKFRQERAIAEQSACSEPGDIFQKRREAGSLVQVEQQHHQGTNSVSKALANMEKGNWMKESQILGGFQLHRYVSDNDCSASSLAGGSRQSILSPPPGGLHKTVSASNLLIHSSNVDNSGSKHGETSLPPSPKLQHKITAVAPGAVNDGETVMGKELRSRSRGVVASTPEVNKRSVTGAEGKEVVPAAANAPAVIITKPSDVANDVNGGGLLSLIEKRLLSRRQSRSAPCTPESTPNATPSVTPTSSPQMGRRSGNPFFTGSSNSSAGGAGGSWLFRPAQPGSSDGDRSNIFYESKVETQVNPATKTVNKNVRYVPRPSELRELNFWSPTSM